MKVPELTVRRVLVDPVLLEAFIFHPPMSTGAPVGLYSSMNSSFPALGPLVRNSLITMWGPVGVGVAVKVGVGVAVIVTVAEPVGVKVRVGVGEVPPIGVKVAVGVGKMC